MGHCRVGCVFVSYSAEKKAKANGTLDSGISQLSVAHTYGFNQQNSLAKPSRNYYHSFFGELALNCLSPQWQFLLPNPYPHLFIQSHRSQLTQYLSPFLFKILKVKSRTIQVCFLDLS
ncbi:hypothetical protein Hanom_Chr17g01543961 [Helianthus anomalus]